LAETISFSLQTKRKSAESFPKFFTYHYVIYAGKAHSFGIGSTILTGISIFELPLGRFCKLEL